MIYVYCLAVLAVGLVLAFWLKREGERSYARHREMIRRRQQREALVRLRITLVDNLTPALRRIGEQAEALRRAMAKVGESLNKELPR